MDEEQSLSDIDWEIELDMIDVQKMRKGPRRRGRDGRRPKPVWTAAMTDAGHGRDEVIATADERAP